MLPQAKRRPQKCFAALRRMVDTFMTVQQVIQCTCGAKFRVAENHMGRVMRCPKCKAELTVPAGAAERASAPETPSAKAAPSAPAEGTVCPICQTGIAPAEAYLACPQCGLFHHQECWHEIGGCSTYGCKAAPAVEKEAPAVPLAAWGDDKVCPVCGERIKAIALKCRYCNSTFDTVDPLNAHDIRGKVHKSENEQSLKISVSVLFAVSLLGLLAPIMAIIGAVWVWPRRKELTNAGPVFLILGYCALGLSLLYSFLMVMFLVFGRSN